VGIYDIDVTSLPAGLSIYYETNQVIVEESNPLSIVNALLVVVED
jgi:hypothetical protein